MIAILSSVSHQFKHIIALNNIDADINSGEILSLLGPNGAGKSTFIHLLLGQLRLQKGRIDILNGQPNDINVKQQIGVASQNATLPDTLKVREHIKLFSSYYCNPMPIERSLKFTELDAISERRFSQLSGGQKQRVLLAIAICGNPKLVFLDEPTVGLDVSARHQFWEKIRALAKQCTCQRLSIRNLRNVRHYEPRIIYIWRRYCH